MSLAIGLTEHGQAIQDAYSGLIAGRPAFDWLLLTYSAPTTNELMLQSTGQGLEELEEEWNDGRIQFGLARVVEPMTGLSKLVYIAWCGEGVPTARKGKFASHAGQVGDIFKGYHLQINARTPSDVEPKAILRKLEYSGGSKYSTGATVGGGNLPRSSTGTTPSAPPIISQPAKAGGYMPQLGKKAPPASKVFSSGYTAQPAFGQIPSPALKQSAAPAGPPATSLPGASPMGQTAGEDDWDSTDYRQKKPIVGEQARAPVPTGTKSLFGGAVGIGSASSKPYSQAKTSPMQSSSISSQTSQSDMPEPVRGVYEPVQLAKPKPLGNRFPFAQPTQTSSPAARSSVSSQGVGRLWEQRQSQARTDAQKTSEQLDRAVAAGASAAPDVPQGIERPTGSVSSIPLASDLGYQPKTTFTPNLGRGGLGGPPELDKNVFQPAADRGGLGGPALPPPPSNGTQEPAGQDEDDWDAGGDDLPRPTQVSSFGGLPPPPAGGVAQGGDVENEQAGLSVDEQVSHSQQDEVREREAEQVHSEEAARRDERDVQVSEQQQQDAGLATGQGPAKLAARAIYSYEAAEENEVSFSEDDVLTDLELVDEGWWIGTNTQGDRGLFPSNYCSLIESQEPAPPTTLEIHDHLQDTDVAQAVTPEHELQQPTNPSTTQASAGLLAIALYDYEAGEDNEISFRVDDTITNVELVSEDWWSGEIDGVTGVFPASYVRMVES